MSLHFGGRTGDAEQFRSKAENLAIVKCDMKRSAVLREPDLYRPRRAGIGYAQLMALFTVPICAL
jgi:hypothetical protein